MTRRGCHAGPLGTLRIEIVACVGQEGLPYDPPCYQSESTQGFPLPTPIWRAWGLAPGLISVSSFPHPLSLPS